MRLDLLFAHAAVLGLDVEWRDLGSRRHGQFHYDTNCVVLNTRLTRAQATGALAHEVGHAVFGDRCSSPRNERRADEYGASLIILVKDYQAAERAVGPHAGALAEELCVTPRMIEAWRRWYARKRAR